MGFEDSLKSWAKAPGQTELDKCDNAVTAVRKAIAASEKLSKLSIQVFAQGSYCKPQILPEHPCRVAQVLNQRLHAPSRL